MAYTDPATLLALRGLERRPDGAVRVYVHASQLGRVVYLDLATRGGGATIDDGRLPARAIKAAMPGVDLPTMSQAMACMLRDAESLLSDILAAEPPPEPVRRKLMAPA